MSNQQNDHIEGYREYVTIGEAAEILGISIDTVRRWEKSGKLQAERLDGKNRFFPVDELEAIKSAQVLSTSEVAKQLGVSVSTVRRLEKEGGLNPERDERGRRQYTQKVVDAYMNIPEEIQVEEPVLVAADAIHTPTIQADPPKQPRKSAKHHAKKAVVAAAPVYKSRWFKIVAAVTAACLAIILLFTAFFLLFPNQATRFMSEKQVQNPDGTYSIQKGFLAKVSEPFSNAALGFVSTVNPETGEKIRSEQAKASGLDEALTVGKDGVVSTKYGLSIPNSSGFSVGDNGLVNNLNSEYVGDRKPGTAEGNLAVLPLQGSYLKDKTVTTKQIADNTIQISNLAPALVAMLQAKGGSSSSGFISGGGGSQGPAGPAGQVGAQGLQGAQGVPGADGATGATGATGAQGPAGPGGGSTGVQSSDGSTLVTGVAMIQFGPVSGSSGEFTVTDLGGSEVRIQLGANVLQTTNYTATLNPIYVNVNESPAAGDISGNFQTGFTIGANAVALGSDTVGNYIATLASGAGLSVSGSGSETAAVSINLDVTTAGTTANTSSNSGLEVAADGLRLLGGCSTNQILKWTGSVWQCSADTGGINAVAIQENGSVISSDAIAIDYVAADFTVTAGVNKAVIGIDYNNSGITRRTSDETIVGDWTFDGATFTTSITTPEISNTGQLTLRSIGAGNDITLNAADKIILTGFDCSPFANGGVLTVGPGGVLTCDDDDGGAAGTITGSGSTNRIPIYTGSNALGSSWLAQNGSTIEVDNGRGLSLLGGNLSVSGSGGFTGNVNIGGTLQTGNTARITNGGALQNVTADSSDGVSFNANVLSSGTISNSRLNSAVTLQGNTFNGSSELVQLTSLGRLPTLDGSALTNINATSLNGQNAAYYLAAANLVGTINDASLTSNVTTAGNTFNGANQLVRLDNTGKLPTLDGSLLSNVNAALLNGQAASYYTNASNLSSGVLSDTLLSTQVTKAGNAFNGVSQLVQTTAGGALPTLDGSALTNVNAASLNGQAAAYYLNAANFTGTLDDNRLSANVTIAGNTFNGNNELVRLDNTGKFIALDGSALTNINASLLGGQSGAYYLDAGNLTGSIDDGRLSASVTTQGNTFNGANQLVRLDNTGKLTGIDGSALTNISATLLNGQSAAYYLDLANTTGTLDVARGGTGATSFTSNAVLFGNGSGAIQETAAGTGGQVLLANSSGVPTFTTLTGDITISDAGVTTIGANSINLGSDTVGDYMASLGTLTGLSTTGNSGEGSTPTLAVLYGATADTAVQGNTTLTCASGTGNLTGGGGGAQALGGGITCGNITTNADVSFATAVRTPLLTNAGALTVSTTGANDLTLTSGSNTIVVNATQLSTTTDLGINFNNSAARTLTVTNVGSGVAHLDVSEGDIKTANVTRISNTGVLSNVTANTSILTAGQLAVARGGTGVDASAAAAGTLLIGNGSGYSLATLSQGTGINISNGAGSITIAATLGTTIGNAEIENDAVTLGTQTTGNYVQGVTAGTGISVTGSAGEGWSPSIAVLYGSIAGRAVEGNTSFTCASGTGNLTGGGGGAQALGGGITCGNITTNADVTFSTAVRTPLLTNAGAMTVSTTGANNLTLASGSGTIIVNATTLQSTASQTIDLLNNSAATTLTVTNSSGSQVANLSVEGGITSGSTITVNTGVLTTAIDLTDPDIVNALSIGDNTILGGNAVIDFTNFDLAANGNVGLTGNLTLSGDAGEGINGGGLTDCSTTYAKLQWSSATNKFSCGSDLAQMISMNEQVNTNWADNDTTELWNTTKPSITIESGSEVLVLASFKASGDPAIQNESLVARIDREGAGVVSDCADINTVGPTFAATYTDNATGDPVAVFTGSTAFVDAPGAAGNFTYAFCTSSETVIGGGTMVQNRLDITLYEVNNAADLAEIYATNDGTLVAGEVVTLDPSGRTSVQRSGKAYDSSAIGIVATKPGLLIGGRDGEGTTGKPIALSGRVPVKVSAHNGAIKKGDMLTSSDIPGVAMKATKAGATLGVAMTDFNGSGVGEVIVFVQSAHGNGSIEAGTDAKQLLTGFMAGRADSQIEEMDASTILTDRLAASIEIVTPKLVADEVQTAKLVVGTGGISFVNENGEEVASISEDGVLSARSFNTMAMATATDTNAVTAPPNASQQPEVAPETTENPSGLTNNDNGQFTSLTTERLVVNLEMLLNGALIVEGPAEFRGETLFDSLVTFGDSLMVRGDAQFQGTATFNNSAGGYAQINSGQQRVRVTFTKTYSQPPVVTATLSGTSYASYSYENVSADGFDIILKDPATDTMKFSWTALSVTNPVISSSQ